MSGGGGDRMGQPWATSKKPPTSNLQGRDPSGNHCIHPRKTHQLVGEVVTQSACSRGRNRCPHPSPARQMTQVEVASTECGIITLTVSQGWRGYIKSSTQAGVRDCTVKQRPRASIGRTYASLSRKRINVDGFDAWLPITRQLPKPGMDPHVFN